MSETVYPFFPQITLSKLDPSLTMYDGDIANIELEAIYHEDYHVQIKVGY